MLVPQSLWDSMWSGQTPQKGFEHFEIVAKDLPKTAGLEFFEVGCAPGGILAEFCGRLGYVAHGIDYSDAVHSVGDYLRKEGVRVGEIHHADFLTWATERRYDIVASFGFIEHFTDPAQIIDRHFELVRPGGIVIVTMPNLARGQKVLHWLFDRHNLGRHNTRCMNLRFFRAAATRNRAEILTASYVGGNYDFWYEEQPHSWVTLRVMWRTLRLVDGIAHRMPKRANQWFSPYIIGTFRARGG